MMKSLENNDVKQSRVVESRTNELFVEHWRKLHVETHQLFIVLFVAQWVGGIAMAVLVSPQTWIGEQSQVHVHLWAAILLGGTISSLPILLALRFPNQPITRHVVAVAQVLWSALLIHLSGGRIETHFHIFGSLAFLAFYRDWKVLATATLIVIVDHAMRGIFWPLSVFGLVVASPYRWMEHAAWVLFIDIFLAISCRRGIREMREICQRQSLLENASQTLEKTVVEAAPNGMVMVRRDGTIRFVNSALSEMFGYTREDLIGQPVEILLPESLRAGHPSMRDSFFRQPLRREMGAGRELFAARQDGSNIPVEIGLNPVETDEGLCVLASVIDISTRRQLEQRFHAAVVSAPIAMLMVDRAGVIVLANNECERLFGYDHDEMLGQAVEILVPMDVRERHPKVRTDFFANPVTRKMGAGRDLFGRRKDGSEVPVEIGLNPVDMDNGTFVLAAIADISERKKSERALRETNKSLKQRESQLDQLNAELRRSNEELEQFAYVASHDLQEPLRKISSYSELLREECGDQLSEESSKFLGIIEDGSERLKTLVRDLLSFSRITTRGRRLTRVDANECLKNALANLEIAIGDNNAEVTYDELPTVAADPSQLTLLFQNLIGNGLKYRCEGTPTIHIGGRDVQNQFEFSVQDNGIGIEPQYFERVFEIFKRLHGRKQYSGTGIGLALCKRVVERFGGKIWLDSIPGTGSTFYFTLEKHEEEGQ